jgi:hypothetical protein
VLVVTSVLVGCASAPAQPTNDPQAAQRLSTVISKRQELQKEIASLAEQHRDRCEFEVGDCLLTPRERRDELMAFHTFYECPPVSEKEARRKCIDEKLAKEGQAAELADVYAAEIACYDQVLECAAKLTEADADAAWEKELAARRQAILGSGEATTLQAEVDAALERVTYLRATLPPAGDDLCQDLPAVKACHDRVDQLAGELEAELGKRGAAYDPKAAAARFAEGKRVEATCTEPEFECLYAELGKFGSCRESRKFLKRNLELIDRKAKLVPRVSADMARHCVTKRVVKSQEKIVKAYARYARAANAGNRVQLQRAFVSLHRAQVACLEITGR